MCFLGIFSAKVSSLPKGVLDLFPSPLSNLALRPGVRSQWVSSQWACPPAVGAKQWWLRPWGGDLTSVPTSPPPQHSSHFEAPPGQNREVQG